MVKKLVLTVIADNRTVSPLFKPVWGLSICISAKKANGEVHLLFDTDTYPHILDYNSRLLNIELKYLDGVVISHSHGDHTGGLSLIPHYATGIPVYIPLETPNSLKKKILALGLRLVEVEDKYVLDDDIYIVGGLNGRGVHEQSLSIVVDKIGLVILVGCSHPGVVNMVRRAYEELKVKPYAVIGGFHLEWSPMTKIKRVVSELLSMGIQKIGPMHCSGERIREYLRERFPKVYLDMRVGSMVTFTA